MKFIVYNKTGKMLRQVSCPSNLRYSQAKDDEFVMKDVANDATQKVKFDGLDKEGQPINPRVVDKTPEEIEADNPTPPEIPESQRQALITNEQWQSVLSRLSVIEKK